MDWYRGVIRQAAALAVLIALILSPVIVSATHGPGMSAEGVPAAEHLLHGHAHDEPEPGPSGVTHDATDHEHQTQVLVPDGSDSVIYFNTMRLGYSEVAAGSLLLSGPRRPPRVLPV